MRNRVDLAWGMMDTNERAMAVGVMGLGWLGGTVVAAAAEQAGKKGVNTMEYARTGASMAFFMLEVARE
jgi:hypothetical protein